MRDLYEQTEVANVKRFFNSVLFSLKILGNNFSIFEKISENVNLQVNGK
jgi:hypothetical protein